MPTDNGEFLDTLNYAKLVDSSISNTTGVVTLGNTIYPDGTWQPNQSIYTDSIKENHWGIPIKTPFTDMMNEAIAKDEIRKMIKETVEDVMLEQKLSLYTKDEYARLTEEFNKRLNNKGR